jgi:hypothetical protein
VPAMAHEETTVAALTLGKPQEEEAALLQACIRPAKPIQGPRRPLIHAI